MKKNIFIFMIGWVLILSACGDTTGSQGNENDQSESDEITIAHELGETPVKKNPEKVVVFDFGILDTLDQLNIDVAAIPQATIPSYLEKYESDDYENVGSLKEPDFETIANIDPDLIIISGRQSSLYDELSELGPTIFLGVDTMDYMDSFKENMDVIGEVFEKEAEMEQALAELDGQIDALYDKATEQSASALIILANDDKINAYGPQSRFGLIHDVFGLTPVDEDIEISTHGMNVSFEYVMERDPDYLYVIDRGAAIGEESSAKQIVENKLVEQTTAYENDQIVYLHPDYWYLSGGGLASVSKMVEEVSDSLD